MILLRIFLYLICITSLGWSILVFGGPPLIKRFVALYTDGAVTASGVAVSPTLDISISRLDFMFQNDISGRSLKGFSRASEISWSIFGKNPALELNFGPSVLDGYGTADRLKISTPTFQEIDWKNIAVSGIIDNLYLNSFGKMHSLVMEGNLSLASAKLLDAQIEVQTFISTLGGSTYSVERIISDFRELSLNSSPFNERFFTSALLLEDITVSDPELIIPEASVIVAVTNGAKILEMDIKEVRLSSFGGFIENLKAEGKLDKFNTLQELNLDLLDSVPFRSAPTLPSISVKIKKTGDQYYQASIQGKSKEFEISNSDFFIGVLPQNNLIIDLSVDRSISKVSAKSKINFNTLGSTDIGGSMNLGFRSDSLMNLECLPLECELFDFDLAYEINLDGEWIRGSADCAKYFCDLPSMDHLIRTSDTLNVLTVLNEANILSPMSSLYLIGVISSGQKINDGHELKFQF